MQGSYTILDTSKVLDREVNDIFQLLREGKLKLKDGKVLIEDGLERSSRRGRKPREDMNERYEEIRRLRYEENLPWEDVASQMGLSVKTTKIYSSKAKGNEKKDSKKKQRFRGNIDDRYNEARKLRYEDGLKWDDVASKLGIEINTAKFYATRGQKNNEKTKLRRKLSAFDQAGLGVREMVNDLINSGEFDNDTQAIYHLAEEVKNRLSKEGLEAYVTPRTIRANSSQENLNRINEAKPLYRFNQEKTTLERFLEVRNFLAEQSSEQLQKYGKNVGSYFLAHDLKKKKKHEANLERIFYLIPDMQHLKDLMKGKNLQLISEWNPKCIDLKLNDAEGIVNVLRESYEESQEKFFNRYGIRNGTINIMRDLIIKGVDLNCKKIHTLIMDGQDVADILETQNPRFNTEWRPQLNFINNNELSVMLEHLNERYTQNTDGFFNVYGSELGAVILSKDLKQNKKIVINPARINSIVNDGKSLEELLEIEDKRFTTSWNPKSIAITIDNIEELNSFLREAYEENDEKFFHRYGSKIGAYNISKDLKQKKGINIAQDDVRTLFNEGGNTSLLLNIKDERFSKWKQQKVGRETEFIEQTKKMLKRKYNESPDDFFDRYGSPDGAYNLALDLQESGEHNKRINIHDISEAFKDESKVRELIDIDDKRFENEWDPRHLNVHLDSMQIVIGHLKKKYEENDEKFFHRYGKSIGTYNLAKDLKKKGLELHLLRLGTVVNKGSILSRFINVDDEKFETNWKPRELAFSIRDLDSISDFMKEKYEEDSETFFDRYGSKSGQRKLEKDFAKRFKKSLGSVSTLIRDGQAISDLLGVPDERFKTKWEPNVIIGSSKKRTDMILDFLKEKYDSNPENFFKSYGKFSGGIDVARDLFDERGVDLQLSSITSLTSNGEVLESYLDVEDKRFKKDWNQRRLRGKFSEVEETLEFLKERFFEDPDETFNIYGGTAGVMELYNELKTLDKGLREPSHLSDLLNTNILMEQLEMKNERLINEFNPKRIEISEKNTKLIFKHLTEVYERDPDYFFKVYGSKLGKMVLHKEFGFSPSQGINLRSVISKGPRLEELLRLEDDRFSFLWFPKIGPDFEKLAIKGLRAFSEGKPLPDITDKIDGELIEYLRFRYNITRGVIRPGRYDPSILGEKEPILRLVELYLPDRLESTKKFIGETIIKDRETLEKLSAEPAPILINQYASEKAIEAKRLRYEENLPLEEIASRLGVSVLTARNYSSMGRCEGEEKLKKKYSKEELIKIGRKNKITSFAMWIETEDLPSYNTIARRFGSWGKYMEAVNDEEEKECKPPAEKVKQCSYSLEDFSFDTGKLLYSFDRDVRLGAQALLIKIGEQNYQYKNLIKKGGKLAEVTHDIFNMAMARYDPYMLMREDKKNIVFPLNTWLLSYLRYATQIMNSQEDINGKKCISIDSGGYEDSRTGKRKAIERFS